MTRLKNSIIISNFFVLLIFLLKSSSAANILAIFHTPSKSHLLLAQPLLFELARIGHEITVVSPFPEKDPPERYIDVPVPEVIEFTRGTTISYHFFLIKTQKLHN